MSAPGWQWLLVMACCAGCAVPPADRTAAADQQPAPLHATAPPPAPAPPGAEGPAPTQPIASEPAVGATARSTSTRRTLTGDWGGLHVLLTLTASGGRIEYDCGQGTIDAPLRPDAGGAFSVRGTHLQGHGGPARVQEDEPTSTAVPANYSGTVNGDTMRLRVTSNGDELGTYTLRRGADPQMVHCL